MQVILNGSSAAALAERVDFASVDLLSDKALHHATNSPQSAVNSGDAAPTSPTGDSNTI